jgi:predicted alpha-1,2-mannosidase
MGNHLFFSKFTSLTCLLIMYKIALALLLVILFLVSEQACAQKDYTKLVNPFIGTGGHGHTYPGATSPFGFVQLSPDTRMADWDGSSGYHYSDSIIYGFSHTHLSGTGVPDYCDILLQPTTGEYEWDNKKYASKFKHASERAYAGFYGVHLDKYNINVRLTTTTRTGLHRYHFPENTKVGNVILDLIHRDIVLDSYLEVVDDYTIKGYRFSKSWANNQKLFFVAKFNKPIIKKAIHSSDSTTQLLSANIAKGKTVQAGFSFDVSDGNPLLVQVALSPVSMEGAALNLAKEQPNFNFDNTLQQNQANWNGELKKIEIESQAFNNIDTIFYTALYHTMIVPNVYQDVDGQYRGTDDKIHKAEGYTNYTVFSLWDTYRAYHPLMSIINKERTRDWVHTFLNQYKQGGMLPVWELSGNETFCMIGYHSIPVIVDAYKKGIKDFDTQLALEAMLSYSKSNRFGIEVYAKKGFLSNEVEHESVSKTMEYAYDDWCIAEFAKLLGKEKIAEEYYKRSLNYRNLYNPATGFFQGKLQASWYTPFDPNEINNFYTEGNAWQYSMYVPHDIYSFKRIIGEEVFETKLQQLFTTSSKTTGRDQADVTGLIGQYAHGNEPSHHMAYLFRYTNNPELTPHYINKICKEFYKNTPDGLIGNEDCGQMSAWYIWSVLGMYPINPAANEYVIGAPQVKSYRFSINDSTTSAITINEPLKLKNVIGVFKHKYTNFINYSELINAQFNLMFTDEKLFNAPENSKVVKLNFPVVPFIKKGDVKFKKSTIVELGTIYGNQDIYYFINKNTTIGNASPPLSMYSLYENPLIITDNSVLNFYVNNGTENSALISQSFYKLPTDKTIAVLSKVNPMYTAGGDMALIDGIKGTANWRAGEWQSYYGNDFEAIIDLKKIKSMSSVLATFLQDIGSWIWMPTELEIYSSKDNKNFVLQATLKNTIDEKNEKVQALDFKANFKTIRARYIKIKAKNYGTIPAWHLGAGNPSHIFLSEIEIN